MNTEKRKVLYGIFAAAVLGCISVTSAADDTYKDGNGDVFTLSENKSGVNIIDVKDNGDGKLVVPAKIGDKKVTGLCCRGAGLSSLDISKCT